MSANMHPQEPNHTIGASSPSSTTAYLHNLYPEELLQPNKGINIREFWNVILRNKRLLLAITGLAFLIALSLSILLPPSYRATATIQIERQSTAVVDVLLETSARRSERDYWQTQMQLLQSRTLATSVMEKLGIREQFISSAGFLSSIRSGAPSAEDNFLKGLTVEPLSNSQLVMIHYESRDPELSSNIVNTLAETFIDTSLQRKYDNAENTQKYLQTQLVDAKKRLKAAENKLDEFARENKIISLDENQTTSSLVLKQLSDELVDAEKLRIKLENEAKQLEIALNSPDPSLVLDTPYMRTLKKNMTSLENEHAAAKAKYGSRSRTARRIQRQIDTAKAKIRSEAILYQETHADKLKQARIDEQGLLERLEKLQESGLEAQEKINSYNNLKREVSSNQTLYEGLVEQIKEVGVASGIDTNNIVIIDRATPPSKKYKPKLKTNVVFGTLMGLLLGIGAIFIREFMDDSIKDVDELEKISQLPMLGLMPEIKGRDTSALAQQIITEPRSLFSEAIRSLRTTLSFSTQDGAPQTLFFTSSEAGEGKTTIALNLAAAYAMAGENVLLIDADLRSPSMHNLLKLDNRRGLSNVLSGSVEVVGSTQQTTVAGLNVLTSGPLPPDPVELLSGRHTREMLNEASQLYDRILIDGPPVLGLADALILANNADATLVTVRSEITRKAPVQSSLKRLGQAKARVLGTLMNRVTPNNSAYSYHYGPGPATAGYVNQSSST